MIRQPGGFRISSTALILLLAAYFSFALNLALWRFIAQRIEITSGAMLWFAFSLPLFVFIIFVWIFSLLLVKYAAKPLIAALFLLSGAANYAMFSLGVYIDSEMIRNVFESNAREASDFVTLNSFLWVFMTGALPALALILTRVEYRPLKKEISTRAAFFLVGALALAGIAATSAKEYAAFFRNHNAARKLINTFNYLYSTARYFQLEAEANQVFVILDANARANPYPGKDETKTILILIVGETARAANFSLQGYARDTNPLLSRQNIIYSRNARSCGTATAVSVPCMFSHTGRREFDLNKAKYSENLLDILIKGGYEVLWWDNDDGCKGVCDRVPTEIMKRTGDPRHCEKTYCRDEALLEGLEAKVKEAPGNTVIVLHAMGSHGPSYYQRYPERFRQFTPTCDTTDIQNCSRAEIVNTYDNTILYTDYFISSVIDVAKKFPEYEIGVIYASDHGESLGENGIYLHGVPYAIAPEEQKHIPMIFWLSETMKRLDYIDETCVRRRAENEALSHDNLFHSIVSLLEIKTSLYHPEQDIFNGCRTANPYVS